MTIKVKIPKTIKVAGRSYTIKFSKDLLRDNEDRGQVCFGNQIIQLYDRLDKEQLNVTFLHEIIHAIDEHLCGRAGINEKDTNGLAEGIFQLFTDLDIEFDWSEIS